jgi:hypothetical protein
MVEKQKLTVDETSFGIKGKALHEGIVLQSHAPQMSSWCIWKSPYIFVNILLRKREGSYLYLNHVKLY